MLVKLFLGLLVVNVVAYATQASADTRSLHSGTGYWTAQASLTGQTLALSDHEPGASHSAASSEGSFELLRSACVQWALTKVLSKVGVLANTQDPAVVAFDFSNAVSMRNPGGSSDVGFSFSETSIELSYALRF